MSISREHLNVLWQFAGFTLDEIAGHDSELLRALNEQVAAQKRLAAQTAFAGASKEVQALIGQIDFASPENSSRTVRAAIAGLIDNPQVELALQEEIAAQLCKFAIVDAKTDTVTRSTALKDHPVFRDALAQSEVVRLATVAQLPAAKIDKVLQRVRSMRALDDTQLRALVEEQALTPAEAKRIGFMASVANLADGDIGLAKVFSSGLELTPEKLIRLTAAHWETLLQQSGAQLPENHDIKSYAAELRRRVAELYPAETVFQRIMPRRVEDYADALTSARPLFERNKCVAGAAFNALNTAGLKDAEKEAQRAVHSQLRSLARRHPGLDLAKVIDGEGDLKVKTREIGRRLDALTLFERQNGDVDVLGLDLMADSADLKALEFGGIQEEDRKRIVKNLKAYQRTYALAGEVSKIDALLDGGYTSSVEVASDRLDAFTAKTGFDKAAATAMYAKAQETAGATVGQFGSVLDAMRGDFSRLAVGNVSSTAPDFLRKLDGFAELFGAQEYCDCEHCRSVLGPAAYFVDLMKFVDESVTTKYFAPPKDTNVLSLKMRRHDLWDLPLTCENTNTEIPTLDVINEVLENYVALKAGYTGPWDNRIAIMQKVYQETLQLKTDSFRQPFVLPFTRVAAYLAHFSKTPADAMAVLGVSGTAADQQEAHRTRVKLGLSKPQYDAVTTVNTNLDFLKKIYRVAFTVGANGKIDHVETKFLLKYTGMSREDIAALKASQFVTARGAETFGIVQGKRSGDSVQNDIETVQDLTPAILDRLHRFVRLQRYLPTNIQETDLLIDRIMQTAKVAGLKDALADLASVNGVAKTLALKAEQAVALFTDIPNVELEAGKRGLLDRLFNGKAFSLAGGELPDDTKTFLHPAFRLPGSQTAGDTMLARLMAGLRLGSEQLANLIRELADPLGAKLDSANEDERRFKLSLENLTLLYRHALLAQALKLGIVPLFQLVKLSGIGTHVASLAHTQAICDMYTFWKSSGFSLDDLGFMTHGRVEDASPYPTGAALAAAIVDEVQRDKLTQFADTVFAFLPGVSEIESRAIFTANPAVFVAVPDSTNFRLAGTFDPSDPNAVLTIPPSVDGVSPDDAKKALVPFHASSVLRVKLAAHLSLQVEKLPELLAMTGANVSSPELVSEINGIPPQDPTKDPLAAIAADLVPLAVMFKHAAFDAESLKFVREHPAIFSITDFKALGIVSVKHLAVYRDFTALPASTEASGNAPAVDAGAVREALAGYTATDGFANVPAARLAAAIRTGQSLSATLVPQIQLPAEAPAALAQLAKAAALAKDLGLDGQSLKQTYSDEYADLQRAAEGLVATFRTKYPGDAEFADKLAPIEDAIRGLKRDALVDHMICSLAEFDAADELYQYFLIDVKLAGCARTSRIVAGISALQLYVHRILINLEQNQYPREDPNYIRIPPDAIDHDEWVWRQHYRVWEANRKVFLYPENYIEPDLRDNKTPLFEELEQTLFQKEITEQSVLDAYATYIKGFSEIAKLNIAGTYHDSNVGDNTDILHMFGVTQSDPPTFYYRTVENLAWSERGVVWSPWRKIDVQIPVRVISPVIYLKQLYIFWVEIATWQNNSFSNGSSQLISYRHGTNVRYTTLRADGTWSPPQTVTLGYATAPGKLGVGAVYDGVIDDPLADPTETGDDLKLPRYVGMGSSPLSLEKYTLRGYCWDRVYPEIKKTGGDFALTGLGFATRGTIDFVRNEYVQKYETDRFVYDLLCLDASSDELILYFGSSSQAGDYFVLPPFAQSTIGSHWANQSYVRNLILSNGDTNKIFRADRRSKQIAKFDYGAQISIINGMPMDAILTVGGDNIHIKYENRYDPNGIIENYVARRLGTMTADDVQRSLYTGGIEELLGIGNQEQLHEPALPFQLVGDMINSDKVVTGKIDFAGSLGTYFREIFFHVPALIANHLNSKGHYLAAQSWYHYLFNPTSAETIDVSGTPDSEKEFRRRDRVWRYIEFRNQPPVKLREALIDTVALGFYKNAPFNPDAIARLRISAYQKNVVMKYIDNLMDWADSLFAQFTTESLVEATMLYVMASDILGPRPAKLGSCGEAATTPKTYTIIEPHINAEGGILIEMEQMLLPQSASPSAAGKLPQKVRPEYVVNSRAVTRLGGATREKAEPAKVILNGQQAAEWGLRSGSASTAAKTTAEVAGALGPVSSPTTLKERASAEPVILDARKVAVGRHIPINKALPGASRIARPFDWAKTGIGTWGPATGGGYAPVRELAAPGKGFQARNWHFGRALAQVSPVFCIPENKDLLAYWDRVEDRLFKIRNCMDLTGVKRLPALFAPEIDPRLLVRARAAGLSLEDVLNAAAGSLPPYRFTYLIEKAKQHAATLQSYGSALYAALERQDNDELEHLRLVHQQNILKLTTRQRELDIDVAKETIEQYTRQKAATEYRRDHYQGLLNQDLIPWETTQQERSAAALIAAGIAPTVRFLASIFHLIPQVGAPTAMKYGGVEVAGAMDGFASMHAEIAGFFDRLATSAGQEATFERRREEWLHQVELANYDLNQIAKQIAAAGIHLEIAQSALELHNKNIEHEQEIFDFQNERFTNFGLFTYLSTTMQRLFREAYNGAMAMARLAEQAYRFERNDETTPLLELSYWDAARAGLLSGEKLMLDLQSLERRFIETDLRNMEVTQSFSVAQLDPAALLKFKQTGTCDFSIPEVAFNIAYPGQYRRRIKAVRLTIPCVTGPYTNVGATLTMTGSSLRKDPGLDPAGLLPVPLRRSTTIATSNAQNDAGVFEFSFRDERYMPFEGAGAVSDWQLSLPKNFPPFDYQTITDAIVHIAYTAEFDGLLANNVEAETQGTAGTIAAFLANVGLARTFSLRQEFPSQFSRLLHSTLNTEVQLEITSRHFPLFLQGHIDQVQISKAMLVLRTPDSLNDAGSVTIAVNDEDQTGFARDPDMASLFAKTVAKTLTGSPIGTQKLAVKDAGALKVDNPAPGDVSALDAGKVQDILLHVEFKLA